MNASSLICLLPETKDEADNFADLLTNDVKGGLITTHRLVAHLTAMEVVIEVMKARINLNPSLKDTSWQK